MKRTMREMAREQNLKLRIKAQANIRIKYQKTRFQKEKNCHNGKIWR